MNTKHPVYLIGIDAADWQIVQKLMADGHLPCLSKLLNQAAFGSLSSPADAYAGGVWPDFYTGSSVADHGIYHNKLWQQQRMRVEVPDPDWLNSRPFYETLGQRGHRVCAIDVPMVLGDAASINGVYVGGWGTHDLISRGSWPVSLWSELKREFGKPAMPVEEFGRQSVRSLLHLRKQLLKATTQISLISRQLIRSEQPDVCCIVLGAAHRAGHYLWNVSQLDDHISPNQKSQIENSLQEIYSACDQALSDILNEIPDNARCIVFAVHGMTHNHGWADLGADIVEKLLSASMGHVPKRSLLYRLKRKLPFHWVRPVLTRLPGSWSAALVKLWSSAMYDWSKTPYFPMPMDQAGYVRINLKGRERAGIISPGEEYESLCQRLEQWFRDIVDERSGRPLVAGVERAWQNAPVDAAARDVLPDLLIHWSDLTLSDVAELRCHSLPQFRFEVPDKAVSGRSGNHVGRGWFIATGPGIYPGERHGYNIRDLAPTVFSLLDEPALPGFSGRSINLLEHSL